MQILNGFVKIHRKLIQWGWYQDNVVKGVFLHLLLTAAFRETEWMGRTIKTGQVITSYGRLAEDLGFGVRQIRTAINKLKSTGEITSEATNKYTIITIVNWDDYQCLDDFATSKVTTELTNNRQATDNQSTNNRQHLKNIKNIKNDKNNIYMRKNCACEFFDELWKLYPRKKGKNAISKKSLAEINSIGFDKMAKAIENYKAEISANGTDEQYIMYGSTFFNGGYKDWLTDNETASNVPQRQGMPITKPMQKPPRQG